MVKIIIGNTKCRILGLEDEKVIKAIDKELSYQIQGFQFMSRNNNWDGRYRLLDKKMCFPIGLLQKVKNVCKDHQVALEFQDNRESVAYGTPLILDPNSGFKPREYQIDAVKKSWDVGSGIIKLPTGSGKTLVVALIAGRFNVKTVIYVIGIELLYQMKSTIEKAFPGIKVGMVGDGHCDIQDITIATIWSAASAFDYKVEITENDTTGDSATKNKKLNKEAIRAMVRDAKMFFVDECHYVSCSTVQNLHKESINAKHRFLLSGTPWRDTGDDILIEAVAGPKFVDISASELINKGYLVPPKIYFLEVPTRRGLGKTYQEVYQHYVVENKERNGLIVKATKKLVETGKKVLLLVTKINHGKILLDLLKNDLRVSNLDGRNKTEDRLQAIADMKSGQLDVLIASKIFDQGIDIVELGAIVLCGPSKSTGRGLQRIGRVIRPAENKSEAIVVDFMDNCKYLREHTQARMKIYATEPCFKVILPKKK